MKLVLLILLFSSYVYGADCIPVGTSFEEIVLSKDFRSSASEEILKKSSEAILGMFRYRNQKEICKKGTPQMIKNNCRSMCVTHVKDKGYQSSCKSFCEIQRLTLELSECNGKLKAITEIEKDMRARPPEKSANQ